MKHLKKFNESNNPVVPELPTAEEFIDSFHSDTDDDLHEGVRKMMIEFAKLHVEAALKAASEEAHTKDVPYTDDVEVDKKSILGAYPLKNIK